jgi:hypothetical protein
MRAVRTDLFPVGIVRIKPECADYLRLANKEMFLIWKQKSAMTIE